MDQKSSKIGVTLVGIGSPVMDIIFETTKDNIDKYKIEYGGTSIADKTNRGFFDLIPKSSSVMYIPGGTICNSIRVANWMLSGVKSDIKTAFVGSIGDDKYGEEISKTLEKEGVLPVFEILKNTATTFSAAGVCDKERCLLTEVNASKDLGVDFVSSKIDYFRACDALLVEGFLMIDSPTNVFNLVDLFSKQNKLIALTFGATFVVETQFLKCMGLSNKSDLIIININEARSYVKMLGFDNTNYTAEECMKIMHQSFSSKERLLILTCGTNPVYCSKYCYQKNDFDFVIAKAIKKVPFEEIVDTTACGDSFVGGFLSQYIQGKSVLESLDAGVWAGAQIVKMPGCSLPKVMSYQGWEVSTRERK